MATIRILAATIALLGAGAADAHHSFAMFDFSKAVTIVGTIKEVRWSNPHVWIDIVARKSNGQQVLWGFESTSTATLNRWGWKRSALKVGDIVTVAAFPMRNGSNAGSLDSISLPSGEVFRVQNQGAASPAK